MSLTLTPIKHVSFNNPGPAFPVHSFACGLLPCSRPTTNNRSRHFGALRVSRQRDPGSPNFLFTRIGRTVWPGSPHIAVVQLEVDSGLPCQRVYGHFGGPVWTTPSNVSMVG